MDKATVVLNQSIKKWERILCVFKAGEGEEIYGSMKFRIGESKSVLELGTGDCPLCSVYYNDGCQECPVMKKTGLYRCIETPYNKIENIFKDIAWKGKKVKVTKRLIKLAEKEVRFLKSLKQGG